ncbi:hypothetical protein Adt_33563 [Abeliophyllum distichum]|uniref:Uncharacterized protein n=1 Tax=Abeliophyllum distichum TaxID=126358 RepID=A0ABD1QWK9_9LAMI
MSQRQNSIGQLNLPPENFVTAPQKNKGIYNRSLAKFFNTRQNDQSGNYKQRYENSSQPGIPEMPQGPPRNIKWQGKEGSRPQCHICKKFGYTAYICRYRINFDYKPQEQ